MSLRCNGKFTSNLCDSQVFKTKNSEISFSYMITTEYLLLQTDRYIQFILKRDHLVGPVTEILMISQEMVVTLQFILWVRPGSYSVLLGGE